GPPGRARSDRRTPPHQLLERERPGPDVGESEHGIAEVLAGHRQRQVGALEHLAVEDAAAVGRQVEPAVGQHVDTVGAGWLTGQSKTGGADVNVDPAPFESVSQERLRHRRAADVAGAQEEDLDGATVCAQGRLATLPRRWLSTVE